MGYMWRCYEGGGGGEHGGVGVGGKGKGGRGAELVKRV